MGEGVEAASVENGAAIGAIGEEETAQLQGSSGVSGDSETEGDGRDDEYVSLDGTGTGDDVPEGSSGGAEAGMTQQIIALSEALSVDDSGSRVARVSWSDVLQCVKM
jgi:hypothetical protein